MKGSLTPVTLPTGLVERLSRDAAANGLTLPAYLEFLMRYAGIRLSVEVEAKAKRECAKYIEMLAPE